MARKTTKTEKVTTHNNTTLTEEQITKLPLIGKTINNWRQRNITLLAHPTDADRLITLVTRSTASTSSSPTRSARTGQPPSTTSLTARSTSGTERINHPERENTT